VRLKEIIFIDNKYINLAIVYLKHIQFVRTIIAICPFSFVYD